MEGNKSGRTDPLIKKRERIEESISIIDVSSVEWVALVTQEAYTTFYDKFT